MHLTRAWLLIGLLAHAAVHGEVIRFDRATKGEIPRGWLVAMTHSGGPPQWEIVRDDSAPHPRWCLRKSPVMLRLAAFRLRFGTGNTAQWRSQRCFQGC